MTIGSRLTGIVTWMTLLLTKAFTSSRLEWPCKAQGWPLSSFLSFTSSVLVSTSTDTRLFFSSSAFRLQRWLLVRGHEQLRWHHSQLCLHLRDPDLGLFSGPLLYPEVQCRDLRPARRQRLWQQPDPGPLLQLGREQKPGGQRVSQVCGHAGRVVGQALLLKQQTLQNDQWSQL